MSKDECDWHAKGIFIEGLCYCSGCSSELFNATSICREAMEFMADMVARSSAGFTACDGLDIDAYMTTFEEQKRAEWRKSGGVGAD